MRGVSYDRESVAKGSLWLLAPLLIVTPVVAQQGEVRAACMGDIQRLCPTQLASLDRPGIRACLRDRFAEASEGCRAALRAMMQRNRQPSGGDAQPKG